MDDSGESLVLKNITFLKHVVKGFIYSKCSCNAVVMYQDKKFLIF